MLYYNLSTYLKEKYGKRLTKICIDGGFTCPNRDGKCGTGGCIYCGERGAGEHIEAKRSIGEQVKGALSEAEDGELFIAYFQNFTNTYAPVEELREKYDSALTDERIKILSVGTRPDCITEENAALLKEYQKSREVWVELGLQTANDGTADVINRGYHRDAFEKAMKILRSHGIKVVIHIIIGLPGEGAEDVRATVEYLKGFDIFGIKIHSIYVMKGTVLADMYEKGIYTPPTLFEYADLCAYVLRTIPKSWVVHRITGDCPRELLVAPQWNRDKNLIIAEICRRL